MASSIFGIANTFAAAAGSAAGSASLFVNIKNHSSEACD
jgi:hypothetical protein